MKKNIIILGLVFILLVSSVSAWDWDNSKNYDENTKTITVYNYNFIGEIFDIKLAEYQLTYNTYYCIKNCYAEGYTTIYEKDKLFSDMIFKDLENNLKEIPYKIYYYTWENYTSSVNEYGTTCILDKEINITTGKKEETCSWGKTGSYNTTKQHWIKHDYTGQELEPNRYKWRLEGSKPKGSIDWIGSAFGEDFTEWAFWNEYSFRKNITEKPSSDFPFPLAINMTAGIYNQTVWINVSNYTSRDIYLYYEDNTNWTIGTDTEEINYEIDSTGLGNNPKSVYLKGESGLTALWHFGDGLNRNTTATTGNHLTCTTGKCPAPSQDSVFGNGSVDFDGTDDFYTTGANTTFNLATTDFIISVWFKQSDTSEGNTMFLEWDSGELIYFGFGSCSDNLLSCIYYSTPSSQPQHNLVADGGINIKDGQWHNIIMTRLGGTLYTYIDGIIRGTSASFSEDFGGNTLRIGEQSNGANEMFGKLDELRITKPYGFTSKQASELYNNSINGRNLILGGEETPDAAPIVENQFPNNATTNSAQYINFTYNVSDADVGIKNCTIFINEVANASDTTITETINQSFNLTLAEGTIDWKVSCYDNTDVRGNSTTFNYTRTEILPVVTLNFPDDNSEKYFETANFTYQVIIATGSIQSCSLFQNVTLNQTDITITTGVNQTFNITTELGKRNWTVECLSDLGKKANATTFNYTRLETYVTTQNNFPLNNSRVDTRNQNFTYNVSTPYGTITGCSLYLNGEFNQTDNSITQLVNQTFNVTLNYTHYWNWTVNCESDKGKSDMSPQYQIIYNAAPTIPTNQQPVNNTIIVITSTELTCSGSTDTEEDTINYEFYGGNNISGALLPTAILQNSSLTTFNWTGLTPQHYYWGCRVNDNVSVSGATALRRISYVEFNQNCTGSNTTSTLALNFTFQDESNFTKIFNVTYEATFTVWGNNSLINKTYSISQVVANETLYCISPANASSLNVKAIIEYSKIGYDTRNYFFDEKDTISNKTQHITLFLAFSSQTTDIDITVTDAQDIPLPQILVEAWLYDVGTDTYSLVQSEITSPDGTIQMQLILGSNYRFRFYQNGILVDSTIRFKLVSTSVTFKITTAEKPLEATVELRKLVTNFLWVNTTKNISFEFSKANDVKGLVDICWAVENLSSQNISTLYNTCWLVSAFPSDQDDYIILTTRGYFRAYAYGIIDGITYSIDFLEIDLRQAPVFGNEGLFLGLLVLLALGGLGLASRNPAVTIVMVLFAIIINSMTFLWVIPWYALISIIVVGVILLIVSKT